MRARGFAEGAILAALLETNTAQCQPPLAEDDVRTIASQAAKHQAGEMLPTRLVIGAGSGAAQQDTYRELNDLHPDPAIGVNACPWLNAYIEFSRKWAPRAYDGFHLVCALFVLATVAARRIRIAFGPKGTYTSLYLGPR